MILDNFAGLFSNTSTNFLSVEEFISAMVGMLSIFVAVLGIMLIIFRESQKDAGLQRTEIKDKVVETQIQIAQIDAKLTLLLLWL